MNDVLIDNIKLHPRAKEFLFEYFVPVRRVFSNILGQVETDYISIALISPLGQIFFLSSKPSIEHNLIIKKLWQFDGNYQPDFVFQDKPKLWNEFSHLPHAKLIKHYRQIKTNLITGISIPTIYSAYRVVFSFGFKQINSHVQDKSSIYCEKLLAMGKYALRQINEHLIFTGRENDLVIKPKFKLIISNREIYEHNPG